MIERAFRQKFGDANLLIKFEALLNFAAWQTFVSNADMKSLHINRYGLSSDLSDGLDVSSVGKMTCSVKPRRGAGRFGEAIKNGLLRRTVSPHTLVGIPFREDDDVSLELNDGVQTRRLILGSQEPPNLIYLIEESGDVRPDAERVYSEMRNRLDSELAQQAAVQLGHDWRDSTWTSEQLTVRMPAVRDGT
jgi:hypothetical protein